MDALGPSPTTWVPYHVLCDSQGTSLVSGTDGVLGFSDRPSHVGKLNQRLFVIWTLAAVTAAWLAFVLRLATERLAPTVGFLGIFSVVLFGGVQLLGFRWVLNVTVLPAVEEAVRERVSFTRQDRLGVHTAAMLLVLAGALGVGLLAWASGGRGGTEGGAPAPMAAAGILAVYFAWLSISGFRRRRGTSFVLEASDDPHIAAWEAAGRTYALVLSWSMTAVVFNHFIFGFALHSLAERSWELNPSAAFWVHVTTLLVLSLSPVRTESRVVLLLAVGVPFFTKPFLGPVWPHVLQLLSVIGALAVVGGFAGPGRPFDRRMWARSTQVAGAMALGSGVMQMLLTVLVGSSGLFVGDLLGKIIFGLLVLQQTRMEERGGPAAVFRRWGGAESAAADPPSSERRFPSGLT